MSDPVVGDGAAASSRQQRLVFGEVADTYDRVRPSYPASLFEAVYAYAGLEPGRPARLCESGAGTGKATMVVAPTAARAGWSLTCVEPDAAMAALLDAKLAGVPALSSRVVVSGFEEFAEAMAASPGEPRFDLLFAAQSWHWVDRTRRARDAGSVLAGGGALAAIWNVARPHPPELRADLDVAYGGVLTPKNSPMVAQLLLGAGSTVMPPSSPQPLGAGLTPEAQQEYQDELDATGLFGPVEVASRYWVSTHDTAEWLEVLQTHSDHRMLPDEVRGPLLERVGRVVDAHGGVVEVEYDAVAIMARRLPPQSGVPSSDMS